MQNPLYYILFPLAMYGVAKLFPNKKLAGPRYYLPDTYRRWEKISGWRLVIFLIASMVFICWPLYDYKVQSQQQSHQALFSIQSDRVWWFMLPCLPVLCWGGLFFMWLGRVYLRDDYNDFINYSNQKAGYNAYRAVIPLCTLVGGVGAVLIFLLWNWGIFIYKDKMQIRWYLSLSDKVYSYKQIKSINFIPQKTKAGAHHVVVFDDGQEWNTLLGLSDENELKEINFISKQSGLKIDTIENDPK